MWTIFLKSLLNLLQYHFCFTFWFFGREACGILAPRPGIKPAPPALEGEALTTGPPGTRFTNYVQKRNFMYWFSDIQGDLLSEKANVIILK